MAAQATREKPAGSTHARRKAPHVEQPPRRIMRGDEWVDVSHLTGDELFEAITTDRERWDYKRLSAETGRSVVRLRKWVSNAYAAARTGQAEDDKTFTVPDGFIGDSPWWYAGNARHVLNQIGVMTRDGRAIPYKPTGRTPGAKDLAPRRWAHAPARDAAAGVYREYVELTTRKRDPLTDREARAELCRRHRITRRQLASRINTGKEQAAGKEGGAGQPAEVDKATLQARLVELTAEQRAAGYSEAGADSRARDALAAETGLTRRQLAGHLAAAQAAATDKGDDG